MITPPRARGASLAMQSSGCARSRARGMHSSVLGAGERVCFARPHFTGVPDNGTE